MTRVEHAMVSCFYLSTVRKAALVSAARKSERSTMATIGYHASHEQFPPSELLRLAKRAEQAGFTAAMNSDHFNPWTDAQGQSGFAWSWMGAAMASTSLTMGVVNAPGQRYHPAIIAQALGTLGEMFPGRVWAALGSGQALNEAITGDGWPMKAERNARLLECVQIIRALLRGETVTHRGHVVVEEAKLYTRPSQMPRLIGAAITPETAKWVGSWADGMITIVQPKETLKKMIAAFREGGGEGKPLYLKVQLSWAKDEASARAQAHEQWGSNVFASSVLSELHLPSQFTELARFVKPDELDQAVRISSDLKRHLAWLQEDIGLGFTNLYLHNVNRQQEAFIDAFAENVLPALKKA